MKCVIVRYSEIGLKGKNKKDFEKKLQDNIRFFLKNSNIDFEKVVRKNTRILVYTDKKPDLSSIAGIASYSYAVSIEKNIDDVKKEVSNLIKSFDKKTIFKIDSKRIDKTFKGTSMDIDREVGAFVVEKTQAKVDLKNPQIKIGVEIIPTEALVFDNKHKGFGGLPVGIEGKVVTLIDDDDSIKAAKRVMRRGCDILPVGFKNKDIEGLQKYSPRKLNFEIIKDVKNIEELAQKTNSKAVVVGQTLKNFKDIKTNLLILRPLIAE